MSTFCPTCGNTLYVKSATNFACRTCPFTHAIHNEISYPLALHRKQVDDVLGGAEAWENVDKTAIPCPKCGCGQAFFMQIQTRSADEANADSNGKKDKKYILKKQAQQHRRRLKEFNSDIIISGLGVYYTIDTKICS